MPRGTQRPRGRGCREQDLSCTGQGKQRSAERDREERDKTPAHAKAGEVERTCDSGKPIRTSLGWQSHGREMTLRTVMAPLFVVRGQNADSSV